MVSSQAEKIRELSEKIEELNREMAELRQRLSHYENSNSPPSKNSLLYREMRSKRREEESQKSKNGDGGGSHAIKRPGPGGNVAAELIACYSGGTQRHFGTRR